jgi:alkaline phosphatase D
MRLRFLLALVLLTGFLANAFAQSGASQPSFRHGVASGDPLADRVIIWTRLTPPANVEGEFRVSWQLATTADLKSVVKSGEFVTSATRDYTVKVDVDGLEAGRIYYYQFEHQGEKSPLGRTRTSPQGEVKHLRFVVASCSNYQAGYFNAYARIADRDDLDAVIHLGDYIYEYGNGGRDTLMAKQRALAPVHEILSLADYRTRYGHYRLDPDLQRAHQQHPFITVWDDHETANDSYTDGAQNHNPGEGNWNDRKAVAKQAYAEWMPIRGEAQRIYRTLRYGNLADLIMLDTRIEGRNEQIRDVTKPELYSQERSILGSQQREWLLTQLSGSQAKWKVLGNQVMFAEFNIGWAAAARPDRTPEQLESTFLDIWDGYPAERNRIIDHLRDKINNVVFITGDVHTSYAFDIAQYPSVFSRKGQKPDYNPTDGSGSVAVEFVSPSISSGNFDESLGYESAKKLEYQLNRPLPLANVNPNPHMKFVDLTRHGYFVLDLTADKAQADWFFVDTLREQSSKEIFAESWFTRSGANRLEKASAPSQGKE